MPFTPLKPQPAGGSGTAYLSNNFEFAIGSANSGNHNLVSTDGGTVFVELPPTKTGSMTRATLRVTEGNFSSGITTVKIQKYTAPSTFVDVVTFTVPANTPTGTNISGVINNATLAHGNQLTINLSQSANGAGFNIPYLIQIV